MWFPYYFSQIGFKEQSSTISIIYPIATCIGTFLIGAIVEKFPKLIEFFITGFYIINLGITIWIFLLK